MINIAGVHPDVREEGIFEGLLQSLEAETINLGLNTIRTDIHCFNNKKSTIFNQKGYEISNHFMYKSL